MREYERSTKTPFSEDEKVSIHIAPQGSQFGLTKVANKVDDGPVPMDIGAVKGDKGAGKDGKGKGDKGKWKSGKGRGKKDEHHDWSKDKR